MPYKGGVPVGHAPAIALAVILEPRAYAAVTALALAVDVGWRAAVRGPRRALWRGAWLALGAGAAGVAVWAADLAGSAAGERAQVLGGVAVAGVAYLGVHAGGALARAAGSGNGDVAVGSIPVQAALLSSAALLVLTAGRGWWMAAIAALPLGGVRFAYARFVEARATYDQAIRALAIVPELAGHVPMGHAERTAAYVDAMAEMLGMSPIQRDLAVTAARLHHIGHIALPEESPHEPLQVARLGGDILAETGFLADVAAIVAETGGSAQATGERGAASVVRVGSAFDELVGDDPGRVPGALAIICSRFGATSPAVTAMREALATRPDLVGRAVASGEPLMRAAAEAGVEAGEQGHGTH